MGRSGLGLCPTQNRPNGIGWQKIPPTSNCRSRWVGWIKPSTGGRRVGWHHRFEKTARKLWENGEKNPDAAKNLIGIYEILLDAAEISPDLVRFCQIQSKSHQIYLKYCQNLGFFAEIWKIFAKSGFLSDGSGFLGGGKPKLTCWGRFLVEKTCRRPPE